MEYDHVFGICILTTAIYLGVKVVLGFINGTITRSYCEDV